MMNQIRVSASRLVMLGRSSSSVTSQLGYIRSSSWILPASQRISVDFQSVSVWPSYNFISYSTSKTAQVETSSGNQKSEHGDPVKPEEGASEIETQLRAELSKAVSEAAALRAKAREFEDKYLLALADMENLRTRMNKQIKDSKLYATQSLCKDLTDIEDILQMAISSVPKDQLATSKPLKELYEGLTMTEARLLQVFKSHGLTQVNPMNEKFNPNEHEAVMQKEEEGKESGTIIFVSKLGYKLHDRVIRPAVVGVAK